MQKPSEIISPISAPECIGSTFADGHICSVLWTYSAYDSVFFWSSSSPADTDVNS